METEKIFKTKTGYCHVTPDKIILTRDGVIGNISKVAVGNNISRILIIYGALSIGLLYFAYNSYLNGDTTTTIFFGLIGLYLIYGIVKSRNNSATPIIERKDIVNVTYNAGAAGLTRPRFEIEFNEGGQIKKRLIMLPGTIAGGQNEGEKAVQIMRDEKLMG
ncbi:MAG: phosphoribosylaminoimidazolesuccinocarboxamide synthase [Cyclobacteriaceae bacterium]|nr:phosphoribosylaminoimidazolesuccinocarboxamide synthase [Cyclobacteriaceae bacterium]